MRSILTSTTLLRIKSAVQSQQELLLLLALFISLRVSLLVVLTVSRPQGLTAASSDYDFYFNLAQLSDRGLYPLLDYWVEYPPLFPWVVVAVYKLVQLVPAPFGELFLWFRMGLAGFVLIFDVGNLLLIHWLGRVLHGPRRALQAASIYAILFTPLHVWLSWFDTIPLFFLLLALALIVGRSYSLAAITTGAGFMVKILPILALPLLLKVVGSPRRRTMLLLQSVMVATAIALPFLIAAPRYLIASFQAMASRSPWETPWAIVEGYYGFGQVAPLGIRVDSSTATLGPYQSSLPWMLITVVFAAIYLFLWSRPFDTENSLNIVAFAGLSVNLYLLFLKGYSPQFLTYLAPFALLVLSPFRAAGYLLILGAVNLVEFPFFFVLLENQHWILRDLVLWRLALLLLLSWEYLTVLNLVPSKERLRRVAMVSVLASTLIWASVALPVAIGEWVHHPRDKSPRAEITEYLHHNTGPDTAIILTGTALHQQLYRELRYQAPMFLINMPSGESPTGLRRGEAMLSADESAVSSQVEVIADHFSAVFQVYEVGDPLAGRVEQLLGSEKEFQRGYRFEGMVVNRWAPRQPRESS